MNGSQAGILQQLMATIASRHDERPAGSYTVQLLEAGAEVIGAKIREEAGELAAAATGPAPDGRTDVIHEAADLLYHMLVLLAWSGASLTDVEVELERRFGTSGLTEKAARISGKRK